jgi:hypothetical protein
MRRARSDREFAAKLQTVNEEADECVLWLEVIRAVLNRLATLPDAPSGRQAVNPEELVAALQEATELRAIFASARRTFKDRHNT